MTRLPYMQLWVGDLIASTQHLSVDQFGGYTRIILAMWNAGGTLPNEPMKLARICGISLKRWQSISPDILEFFDVNGDRLSQKRLSAEYQKGLEIIEKRSAAGKLGNSAKALKTHTTPSANAVAKNEECERILTSPPIPTSVSEESRGSNISLPMVLPAAEGKPKRRHNGSSKDAELQADFDSFMKQYPKPVDRGAAKPAYQRARRIASAAELLNGAMRYAQEKEGVDPQYIKTPRSWLDAQSWNNPATIAPAIAPHRDQQLAQVIGFMPRTCA